MHVDANRGNDVSGTGEKNSPVATVTRALELAKNVDPDTTEQVSIIIEDGTYYLDEKILVNSKNHITDKLVIKAADGANPVFVNGITFTISEAVPVTDTAVTGRLADASATENLYQLDLKKKVKLDDIPAISLPGKYSYSMDWVEEATTPTCEMFFKGKPMTVARYPNDEYTTIEDVVNEGATPYYWREDLKGTDGYVEVEDRDFTDVFVIKSERAKKWKKADQAIMFGYWKHNWATQSVPISHIDDTLGSLAAKYPSYFGVGKGQRYYVYNLLEEIDAPGEYFIDRKTGIMYFYMPENAHADDEITMSLNSGSMLEINADNTVVDGLTFTASRGNAVRVRANNVTVKNCEISNIASYAISVDGKNNLVENCTIFDVNGGIYAAGGDSATFTDGGNRVINNDVSRFARLDKTYTFAIHVAGCGNTVSHNELHDSEHTALTFEGTNHTLSYNEIYDVCKEVDDAGAIYVGRTWTYRDNKIINNYIHDICSNAPQSSPVAGIFLDDHFAGAYIAGNVFANIAGDGVRGNLGREHTITNNIFVDCSLRGILITSTNTPLEKNFQRQINTVSAYLNNALWKEKYPILFKTDDEGNTQVNTQELIYCNDNVCTNNLMVFCPEGIVLREYALNNGTVSNNLALDADPGFTDIENGDFTIADEVMEKLIPGFVNVEFEKMGRQ